jgi:hypothetical protein
MILRAALPLVPLLVLGCGSAASGKPTAVDQAASGGAATVGGGTGGAGMWGGGGNAGATVVGGKAGMAGSTGGAAGNNGGQGGGAGMASNDVGGTAIDHHVIPDKTIDVPHDLTTWKIEAAAFDASPLGATVYAGKGSVDGTWTIPGAPVGPYVLHADDGGMYDRYFATSERVIDVGQSFAGRPDAAKAKLVDSTVLQLDLNLAPMMAAFDSIELFSSRAGVYGARGDTMPGSMWAHTMNIHGNRSGVVPSAPYATAQVYSVAEEKTSVLFSAILASWIS